MSSCISTVMKVVVVPDVPDQNNKDYLKKIKKSYCMWQTIL